MKPNQFPVEEFRFIGFFIRYRKFKRNFNLYQSIHRAFFPQIFSSALLRIDAGYLLASWNHEHEFIWNSNFYFLWDLLQNSTFSDHAIW